MKRWPYLLSFPLSRRPLDRLELALGCRPKMKDLRLSIRFDRITEPPPVLAWLDEGPIDIDTPTSS